MFYPDPICHIVTMNVGHIILKRHWLYDRSVTIYGHPNSCSFVHEGKKVKLTPLLPTQPIPETKQTEAFNSKKTLTLISPKLIDKEIAKGSTVVAFVVRGSLMILRNRFFLQKYPYWRNLLMFFLKSSQIVPDSLPPMRDIQQAIDLVLRSSLPNLPHYKMNPTEYAELKRQVDELFSMGFIKESLSQWLCWHC